MAKSAIIGTGLSGLVGSRFVELFSEKYDFRNFDLSDPAQPVDILKFDSVLAACQASSAEVLIHFAAYTDVNKAWEQKGDKNGLAYQVNVVGTENIIKAAETTGKRIIHISTAFVFDGKKKEKYVETDATGPIEWYGETKALAEEAVMKSSAPWTIFRIDQPFRADRFKRPDTVHRVIDGLVAGTLYPQFTDHSFGPTWIDDFARVLDWTVSSKSTGIYHASSGESWTDYDFAEAIRRELKLPGEVGKGSIAEYLKTAKRPYHLNTAMDVSKLATESGLSFTKIVDAMKMVEK